MLVKNEGLFKRAFYVNLSDMFAIEGRMLGKRISFRPSDECVLTIVIPTIVRKGDLLTMSVPDALDKYGIDCDNWGMWNRYTPNNDVKTFVACVSSIIVEIAGNNMDAMPTSSEIHSKGNDVIHALQIINPDAVRMYSNKTSVDLCEISAEVVVGADGKAQPEIHVPFSIDKKEGRLTFVNVKHAIKNVNKPVTMPYEMLNHARVNLSRYDTRSAVLHCATAIEVVFKKLVITRLDAIVADESLKEFVLKQADGYTKLVELCKKCSISLAGLPNVKETVINVRNRVIHGGYVPTRQEAKVAYDNTRQTLSVLKTPMFEEPDDNSWILDGHEPI